MLSDTIRRIHIDIKELEDNRQVLNEYGIYWNYNEDDMFKWYIMIMGTQDTPYEFGYYFFEMNIQPDYPMVPPILKFMTKDSKMTRFNPNLYVEGKVCLSLLNTWKGPAWTPVNSIKSVLITIQSMVFVDNPLVNNEPGFESYDINSVPNTHYNEIIRYRNMEHSCIKQLDKIDTEGYINFRIFKDDMVQIFLNNYDRMLKVIEKHMDKNGTNFVADVYGMSCTPNYKVIKEYINMLYNEYKNKN